MSYEAVIGLEIHLELQTRSKLFCGCSTAFGQEPNTNCCPVCLGLPGSLPVFNSRAIALAVTAALALNSEVQRISRFDRKNYFYPDLPKAYQVSQYERPLAKGGFLEIDGPAGLRRINLERVHLEEEAGKLIHSGASIFGSTHALIDYNRAGIPLLEIVTGPELGSGLEARIFLEDLRLMLLYSGVSDCKMEEGSLRCDANISLRASGTTGLGTKTEVKNMNSFRAVELALEYEAKRQAAILEDGQEVAQVTCHWDEEKKTTVPLRSKEGSSDYRYFPEPDLLPLNLEESFIASRSAALPELPHSRRGRLKEQFGLQEEEAKFFTMNRDLGDFFEATAKYYNNFPNLARWMQGDLVYQLRESGRKAASVDPRHLAGLLRLLDEGKISRPVAKDLLSEIVSCGADPLILLQERGLEIVAGPDELRPLVARVMAENPEAVENYRLGKKKALSFLVGRAMAYSKGRADPGELNRLFKEAL